MDLLLNLLCSIRAAGIDMSNFVVFVGSDENVRTITAMGVKAMYLKSLGVMPKVAAVNYADR